MKLLQELKILTGMGKPNVQYVQEAMKVCEKRLNNLYSHHIGISEYCDTVHSERSRLINVFHTAGVSPMLMGDLANQSKEYPIDGVAEKLRLEGRIRCEGRRLEKLQQIVKSYSPE